MPGHVRQYVVEQAQALGVHRSYYVRVLVEADKRLGIARRELRRKYSVRKSPKKES